MCAQEVEVEESKAEGRVFFQSGEGNGRDDHNNRLSSCSIPMRAVVVITINNRNNTSKNDVF